jgi:hypothetical protein
MLLYISRLFVEFGPFEANEIQSFIQRGLLSETDYLRVQGEEDWMHISDWTPPFTYQPTQKTAVKKPAPKKAVPVPTKKAFAKTATSKKSPVKKVLVKKATAKKAAAKKAH